MKAALKRLVLAGLSMPLVYGALRARALRARPATILCYHTLRPADQTLDAWIVLGVDDFRAQIAAFRRDYDIVSLDDALTPTPFGAKPRLALTFDDGERGLIDHLLPIVQAEALPVTIYVATQHIETQSPFWFDRAMNALQGAGETQITLEGLGHWKVGPERGKARWAQIGPVLEAIKRAPTHQRDVLADQIAAQASAVGGFVPLQPLTLEELKTLASDPHVTIGAHTHGHELLDHLTLEEARASIIQSRDLLRDWIGQEVRHFAYPNGNYTPELMTLLEELGFVSATILEDRLVTPATPCQALPRIGVGRYDALDRLRLRMVGI